MTLARDLRLLADATFEAGRLAQRMRTAGLDIREKAPGDPVSNADIAVDAFLRARLLGTRPGYGWVSEESAAEAADIGYPSFLVDPIDGTQAYTKNRPDWGVSAALVRGNTVVAGAFYAADEDALYTALRGGGAFLNGRKVHVTDVASLNKAIMVGASDAYHNNRYWPLPWPDSMKVAPVNSIALRLCHIAAGKAHACVTLRAKQSWDLAAAQIILQEAGGLLWDKHAVPPVYAGEAVRIAQVIAGCPSLMPALMERVAAALSQARARKKH